MVKRVASNVTCAIFSRDGGEVMKRNAKCFISLFHVNNYLHFLKGASKSSPLLVR